ncbi:hypothetical protein EGK_17215, partial [Macaca mulatta]
QVGWMMWNWMVSILATGAAMGLYDGSPMVPMPNMLWDLVDRIGPSILVTRVKWLSALEEKAMKPVMEIHSLQMPQTHPAIRSARIYECVYRCVKSSVLLGSTSGGIDISCFVRQNYSLPVYKGEIQAQNLGMAMEVWNEEGMRVDGAKMLTHREITNRHVQDSNFWNNENGNKYRKAYFSKFPGIWAHGDCRINPKTGGIVMLGWSDGTLNPNRARFGSLEIYDVVDSFKEVEDSLCVPQYNKYREERVILFLKMASGHAFQPDLVKRIHDTIHVGLSVRHVPSLILKTKGIPYTLNGKKVEVAVKQIIAGKAVEQRGAFSNPEALHLYWDIPELQGF